MEIFAYTDTEVLLWDYSETEEHYVLVKPPARRVRTLYRVPQTYAYQWFGLNGGNNLKIIYYPFAQTHFRNLTNPCDCPPEENAYTATVTVSPSTVFEDGTTPLVYTISLDRASPDTTTVNFALTGTATEGSDYPVVNPHSVTIAAGQTSGQISITPTNDGVLESTETVIMTLTSGTSGSTALIEGGATATGTIVAIFASVAVAPASVLEDSGIPLVFTISLSHAFTSNTTVSFALTGTAIEGVDYPTVSPHTATITAGNISTTVSITPSADITLEFNETIIMTLLGATNGIGISAEDEATGTILNDEPTVTWDPPTAVNVTLSNGNLTATNNFASGTQGVQATVSHSTGKYYFEITCVNTTNPGGYNWGIGQFFALSNTYELYKTRNSFGAGGDLSGAMYSNGSSTSAALNLTGGLKAGDVIAIAVDLDARGIWAELVAGPDFPNPLGWNGNSSANPATGVGPVNVPAGTMFPTLVFNSDVLTEAATFNFGGSAFVGAIPSGFSAWSATATLDPAKAFKVNLTNGNLTATNASAIEPVQIVSIPIAAGKSSGKYYYEITLRLDSSNNGNVSAAFGLTTAGFVGLNDDGLDGIIVYESSNIFANEIYQTPRIPGGGSIGGSDTGDVVGIAIDLDHGNAWFKIVAGPDGGFSDWNGVNLGNLTQNPSTNSGGIFIRAGDRFMPFAIFSGDAGPALDAETANFGATPFIGTVPTGFTPGWPVTGGTSLPTVNTWDPTTAIGCVTSNGNLTVTNQGAAATVQGVKALVRKTYGKFYFEITLDSINPTSTNFSFGVASTMTNYSEIIGVYDMNQVFVFLSGALRQNGGSFGASIGTLHTGDVIGVAVELQNNFDGYVWFKVVAGPDAAGAKWNNNVIGNPNNINTGVYLDGNTVLPFVIFDSTDATDQVTANFGASAFQGAVPDGFNAGWIAGSIRFTNFGWYEPLSVPAPVVKAQPGFSSVPFNTAQLSVNFKNFGWSQPLSRPLRPVRARVLPYNVPIAPKVASGLSWQQPLSTAPKTGKAQAGYSTNTLK